MVKVKLSDKFLLSIPKAVRENMALEPGQQFVLVERGHIIELVPTQSLHNARGSLADLRSADREYRDGSERSVV